MFQVELLSLVSSPCLTNRVILLGGGISVEGWWVLMLYVCVVLPVVTRVFVVVGRLLVSLVLWYEVLLFVLCHLMFLFLVL